MHHEALMFDLDFSGFAEEPSDYLDSEIVPCSPYNSVTRDEMDDTDFEVEVLGPAYEPAAISVYPSKQNTQPRVIYAKTA